MKELLDRLVRSLPVGLGARTRDDPERLARDAARLREEGRYYDAERAARRVVEMQTQRLGGHHPRVASALSDLARVFQLQGDHAAAVPIYRDALEVYRTTTDARDARYAVDLGRLCESLLAVDDDAAAEPLLRELLDLRRESLGEDHPDHAATLTTLGLVLLRRGDLDGSEPVFREALEVRRRTMGDRHPLVAAATANLGSVLQRRGNLEAAEALVRGALEVRLTTLGERHAETCAGLSQLGSILFERGDLTAAEACLRRAVMIRKDLLGARHPDVAADVQTLEAVLRAQASRGSAPSGNSDGAARTGEPGAARVTAAASDSALEQFGRDPREIAAESRSLARKFAGVGGALVNAARGMQHGLPIDPALIAETAACQNAYASLHDEGLRRASALDLAPPPGTLIALPELAGLMDRVAYLEEELPRRLVVHRQALGALDRALALRHVDASQTPLLHLYHATAAALREAVASVRLADGLPSEVGVIVDGTHPVSAFLRLVEAGPELDDRTWFQVHRDAAASFGRPLAAAAARGRLVPNVVAPAREAAP